MAEKKKVFKNVDSARVDSLVNMLKQEGCRVDPPTPQGDGKFTVVAYCPAIN